MNKTRIGWLLGWAVPEAWFAPLVRAALPDAEHAYFSAAADALEKIRAAGPFDWLVGYSLGAQLLLAGGPRPERVALLAPIFAFPREAGLGGRIPRTQVAFFARWLRREPTAALADFYSRAGMDVPVEVGNPSVRSDGSDRAVRADHDRLVWGLDQLVTLALPPGLPAGWRAWCGADDPLLDAARLHALVPGIIVVPGANHHPAALLEKFAEALASETNP